MLVDDSLEGCIDRQWMIVSYSEKRTHVGIYIASIHPTRQSSLGRRSRLLSNVISPSSQRLDNLG